MDFRKRITVYSFVLTVLVIWVHAVDQDPEGIVSGLRGAGYLVQRLLGEEGLGQTAVPGFFCMSGYLFFRNAHFGIYGRDMEQGRDIMAGSGSGRSPYFDGGRASTKGAFFSSSVHALKRFAGFFLGKWKHRFFTLLIPYFLWNLIYLVIYILAGREEISLNAIIQGVLFHSKNPVFWYMEQLIILTLLAPLIYPAVCRKKPGFCMMVLFFISAAAYMHYPFHIVNEDAFFYYSLGAFLSLHWSVYVEKDGAGVLGRWIYMAAVSFAGCVLGAAAGMAPLCAEAVTGAAVLFRASGAVLIFALLSVYACFRRKSSGVNPRCLRYNFFIYATHYMAIRFFRLLLSLVFGSGSALISSFGYLFMPFLCIWSAVVLGSFLSGRAPGLYTLLTGGR